MSSFWKDPDLQRFGDSIAAKYHPAKLADARFNFVFKDGKGTNPVKAQKVPKMWKDLGVIDADYLLVVNAEIWKELDSEQKEAALDHELCHCKIEITPEGEQKYTMAPHDIEDFHEVYERHGDWKNTIDKLLDSLRKKKEAEKPKLRKKGEKVED